MQMSPAEKLHYLTARFIQIVAFPFANERPGGREGATVYALDEHGHVWYTEHVLGRVAGSWRLVNPEGRRELPQ